MRQKGLVMTRYIFPAVGGLFMAYLYNVMDGIFVGQGVGAAALGAVNIGVPFITFVVAIAAMSQWEERQSLLFGWGEGMKGVQTRHLWCPFP